MHSTEASSALLTLLRDRVQVTQRLVHAGDVVYASGSPFTTLFVVTSGALKTTRDCLDGRTRVAALHLAPDWLGFDGIAGGAYEWSAIALCETRLACIGYDELLNALRAWPSLLQALHAEMGREMARHRQVATAWRRLPIHERMGRFLLDLIARSQPAGAETCAAVTLPLARPDIAELLGMTVESVSRALSHLKHEGLIGFSDAAHRCIEVLDLPALQAFVHAKPVAVQRML
jgi:CRP/FNR family transcriptional regulator